jgi:hypothetical protein
VAAAAAGIIKGKFASAKELPTEAEAKHEVQAEHAVEAKHAAKQYKVEAQRKAELVPLFGGEAAAAAVVVIGMFEGKPAGEFAFGWKPPPRLPNIADGKSALEPKPPWPLSIAEGSANANGKSVLEPKPPWLPSIADDFFARGGGALTGANDIGNEACLDFKYPNAWFLPPPWPDDDELSAIAEPPDERRPKPGHELRDGQHHSDRPCTADRNGSTLPSARPC